MKKVLTLVRGLPGSGKSSFSHFIWNECEVCEADKFFYDKEGNYNFDPSKLKEAHAWCKNEVETRMIDNQKIAVSNTFTQEWEMKPYFDLAEKYGYTIFTIIIENRHGNKSIHGVPEETMEKMKNRFEIKL